METILNKLARDGEHDNTPLLIASVTAVCLTLFAGFRYYAWAQNYWKRFNVKGEWPQNYIREVYNILVANRVQLSVDRSREFGKIHGIFMAGSPRLVIADAEVLRQVCIKDFDHFPNHSHLIWRNRFQENFLVWLRDDHWRRARAMMSPQFTSGKIKRMYKLMDQCGEDLLENFREQMIRARRDGLRAAQVDLMSTYSMYTMDGITTCCYGLKLMREGGDTDVKKAAARNAIVRDCNRAISFDLLRVTLLLFIPKFILKALNFHIIPENYFEPIIKRVEKLIEIRRKDKANVATKKYDDFLQMLIEANLDDKLELDELDQVENHHAGLTHELLHKDQERLIEKSLQSDRELKVKRNALKLSDLEIVSEALFLLVAGFETTRTSMSTITYLLAHHQQVQDRLYEELKKIVVSQETPVGEHLTFDYDTLTSCQYLDAVISESLRFFGPVIYTDRETSQDYYIEKYNVTVPKGTNVFLGLHPVANDPDYWHEPERFDPERFMPGQKEKIVPGSYAPFSMGPRHCLGMRFSLTETKLGLAKVLMRYKFAPAPNTKYPPQPSLGLSLVSVRDCRTLVTYRDEASF